jgi:citrate lyase subunit beta/citryl-CoA lyase
MDMRLRRSVLYMPGSNARALEKARTLPADALIFDLEDAVAPDQKANARQSVAATLKAGGYGERELIVRVNLPDGPWGPDDIRATALAGAHAILVPKVSSPDDVAAAAHLLRASGAPDTVRLWIMMETPLAILDAEPIARMAADPSNRLDALVMGVNDLAKETRARQTIGRAPMLGWIGACVLAARAHGLDIFDGVFGDIGDADGFRAECEQGRDMGMDGKTLIHPGQIAACNDVFAPGADEVARAKEIIAAFALPENAGKGAIALNGRMVERLHADIAARTLALAQAIARRAG